MTEHADAAPAAERFPELKPPLGDTEALAEAHRCLFCYDAPCTRACPTHIDVPGFIKRIASGHLRGAARKILDANIFGASCARVCPTEELCEGACVLHDLHGRPIDIGRLQRHATDPFVIGDGAGPLPPPMFRAGAPTGRRVAIVGAGPAGLACAVELVRLGHEVQVFEAASKPGGLNSFGVADYKMDHETALREIDWLVQVGVSIQYNTRVGADISVEDLLERYDALFLGVGLGAVPPLGMPGEDMDGCEDVLDFIARLKTRPRAEVSLAGQRVAVIGGGNTAIDGVTQSVRLGADKVYLVYRRGPQEMGAYPHEQELAHRDGVIFVHWALPIQVLGNADHRVAGLRCVRTRLDEEGALRPIAGSEFDIAVDRVFRATGQQKHKHFLAGVPGLKLNRGGVVERDEEGRTSNPRVWTGGDCANGGKEVVNAVADGKAAARSMHRTLMETT